ncbi:glutamate carboxypeptidase 2-like [Pollicipes pollicipes]|uniref:glutamate carboxypeptidase 2-like n=1 Tax=Pollicipes pollicipes TaxID=41117 RepID=UPI00188583CB|nr:glutamate carboxypeptidase 2-like [Pollicipes pollicipes]
MPTGPGRAGDRACVMAHPVLRRLTTPLLTTAAVAIAAVLLQILSAALGGEVDTTCPAGQGLWPKGTSDSDRTQQLENATRWLHDLVEPGRIKDNLRHCTSTTHVGGSAQDYGQAMYTQNVWQQQQLDEAILNRYDVYLSHPNTSHPSRVYLLDGAGRVKFTSSLSDDPDQLERGELPAYLAFCPSGNVTSNELVYANYGRREDFRLLQELGISVRDRLVIMRFGAMFRGNKIKNAQELGAAGAILYTDPADYGNPDNSSDAYPDSFWLPDTGIQRGTVTWLDGDALTYGYPATEEAFREPARPTANMPLRPCHTLSARDAHKLLANMAGPEAPATWRGALSTTYRLGPRLARDDWSVRLYVNNEENVMPTYNVLGFIRGDLEPDRYIILGNHRDAWSYGSLDPCSASATMMELVRAFAVMKRNGDRPGAGSRLQHAVRPLAWPREGQSLQLQPRLAQRALVLLPDARHAHRLHDVGNRLCTLELERLPALPHRVRDVLGHGAPGPRPLLPIDVRDVEKPLRLGLDHIRRSYGQLMDRHNVSLGGLERAVQRYVTAAQRFHKKIISRTDYSDLELRQINDQMVGVERSFVDPNGLLVDEQNRNAVFGTDPDHEYNGVLFPDVVETLLQVSEQPERPDLWQSARRALAAAIFVVNGAATSLADPSHFVRPWPETEPDQTLTRN